MKCNSFRLALSDQLQNFNLKQALTLSNRIHHAELYGYQISTIEDSLWQMLTRAIEHQKDKLNANTN